MADSAQGFLHGFVDIRRNNKGQQTTALGTEQSTANYNGVPTMRTRLAAINGAFYTAARLNQMTSNDMVYALRLSDDLASIK